MPTTTNSAFVARRFCVVVIPNQLQCGSWTSKRLVLVLPDFYSMISLPPSKSAGTPDLQEYTVQEYIGTLGLVLTYRLVVVKKTEQKPALVVNERKPERYSGLKRLMGMARAGGSIIFFLLRIAYDTLESLISISVKFLSLGMCVIHRLYFSKERLLAKK